MRFDNSLAALDLWNFLLTENDRLRAARKSGCTLIGTMKDLGTVPVMAYELPGVRTFYPDGAWWIPCIMERNAGLLEIADSLGVDDSFCPVRAMLGAFIDGTHFPRPNLLICSAGAVCDDFSSIAQRLTDLGYPILWWEIPYRRRPEPDELVVTLPGEAVAPASLVSFVISELQRVAHALESHTGCSLDPRTLQEGIRTANTIRGLLRRLRDVTYTARTCPIPALEMLIAEMLAIHFCSDRSEAARVLRSLLTEAERRVANDVGPLARDAVRVLWVNPVADLMVMNLLEECGGRICGTDYLVTHALDPIPEDVPPFEALARMALADPMVGPAADRASRICRDARRYGAEAMVISRIPGASHCATEGPVIAEAVRRELGLPVLEIEVPPLTDSMMPTLRTRLQALVETVRARRTRRGPILSAAE
jgi:benzoyl-CoA reductase/2-hydroxyglutaryl-CoA dehydratase subunit BcrC/BadD/HgdB